MRRVIGPITYSAVLALTLSALVHAADDSMSSREREMLRREGAETLAEMLQGVLDRPLVARRLAAKGFAGDASRDKVARVLQLAGSGDQLPGFAEDVQPLEFCDRRSARDCENVHFSQRGQRANRFNVAHARHEHAIRPSGRVCLQALDGAV